MKAKLESYGNKKKGRNIDIPVLRLLSENEEDEEIIDKIFASEKLVPVAIGEHPDHLQDMIIVDGKPEPVIVKRVSLILE